jgi:hypothetical protein
MTTSLNSSRPVLDQDARSGQSRIRTILTASTTLTQELHDGQTIGLNALAGLTVTLPAATGTGQKLPLLCRGAGNLEQLHHPGSQRDRLLRR